MQGLCKPMLDGVCGSPAMEWGLLWDGVCEFAAVGWALPTPGLVPAPRSWWLAGVHSPGSPMPWLPCPFVLCLTWSHPPLLAPMLHPSPPYFGTLPGHLSQLWLLCARPGFGTSGLAMHPHSPQPWQGAGTHTGTPAPWVPQHPTCAAAHGSAQAPPKETCREGTGCLGKQALALAGYPRKIKTSGRAAAQ